MNTTPGTRAHFRRRFRVDVYWIPIDSNVDRKPDTYSVVIDRVDRPRPSRPGTSNRQAIGRVMKLSDGWSAKRISGHVIQTACKSRGEATDHVLVDAAREERIQAPVI